MGLSHSPSIVTRNLLLNLDFGNIQKCYNGSENLLTYSNINISNWVTNASPVLTENVSTSPDGTLNATQIAAPATAGSGVYRTFSLTSGNAYTYSVFVKSVSGSNTIYFGSDGGTNALVQINTSTGVAIFNSGAATNITSTPFLNGWYRISFTFTASTTATHSLVIYNLTASANTWLVYGAQLEKGRSASPYIPTSNSTVTRPTTATSTISNYSHTINQPQYISYDASNNSIRFDRNETFASFTGSISGTVLTVSSMTSGTIINGMALSFTGNVPATYITSFGTGTGGAGTYNINKSVTQGSIAMTGAYKIGGNMNVTTSGALASNTYLYNDHTTEVWARINDINAANYDGYEAWSALAIYSGYHSMFIYTPSIGLSYSIWDNTGPTSKSTTALTIGTSGTDIIQGQWFQVVVTKSGSTFKTYLNGVLKKTDTITSTAFSGVSNDLRLGGAGDGNTGAFYYYAKNNVGCLKMYNTALSADEIRQNFNSLRGRYGI